VILAIVFPHRKRFGWKNSSRRKANSTNRLSWPASVPFQFCRGRLGPPRPVGRFGMVLGPPIRLSGNGGNLFGRALRFGEDIDLSDICARAGYRILRDAGLVVAHRFDPTRLTERFHSRRSRRHFFPISSTNRWKR
jgi:hypothetical protein